MDLKRQDRDYRTQSLDLRSSGRGYLLLGKWLFFLMQKLKLKYFGHLMQLIGKVPDAGKD